VRNPAEALADEIRAKLGGFTPEHIGELDLFFENLPQVFSALSLQMNRFASHAEEHGWISDVTAGQLREIAGSCIAASSIAEAAQESHAAGPAAFWR
jgi:hypothetical protein